MKEIESRLVDSEGLLEALFPESCRPSMRWLSSMRDKGVVPYFKIGHLIFYDIDLVRAALKRRCLVKGKYFVES